MFLNDIGQPIVFNKHSCDDGNEDMSLFTGPMLLSSADDSFSVPANWSGTVYSSVEILDEFKRKHNFDSATFNLHALMPHEPEMIVLEASVIELTLIPAGKNANDRTTCAFFLKDEYVQVLITNKLSSSRDLIRAAGKEFQNAVKTGLDVVYINDIPYRISEDLEKSKQHRYAWILCKALYPKRIVGLTRAYLPNSIIECCNVSDQCGISSDESDNDATITD